MVHDEPPPATVFAFWPWPEPPSIEAVRAALAPGGAVREVDPGPPGDPPSARWRLQVDRAGLPEPLWVWATRAIPLPPVLSSQLERDTEGEGSRLARAAWCIGVMGRLDPRDPAQGFHTMLQCAVAAAPELCALYDAESLDLKWGHEVLRIAAARVPPPPRALYRVQAVFPDEHDPASTGWVHTHGLARAGMPDLELLDVPLDLLVEAGRLIDLAVGCGLGGGALPASPFEIVRGFPVMFRPLAELGDTPSGLGGPGDPSRQSHDIARRTVLVEPGEPPGCPTACLRALAEGAPVAAVSVQETRRMAARAKDTWDRFGMRFVDRGAFGDEFLVKLAYDAGSEERREHLWFEVVALQPGRLRARLLNEPLGDIGLERGDVRWHPLERLTDWVIHTERRTIRPEDV